jgi:hypothetical protein
MGNRSTKLHRLITSLVLTMLAVSSSGCGYALAGRGSFLPAHIRAIAIPVLVNRTAFANAEQGLTLKIREEFIGRGKFTVVPDVASANAVLSGEIVSLTAVTGGLTDQQLASRYLFTLVIKVTFTDTKTDEVLWSNDALTFRDEYDLSIRGPIESATFVDQQPSAVERISTDVARTVVTAIVEAF